MRLISFELNYDKIVFWIQAMLIVNSNFTKWNVWKIMIYSYTYCWYDKQCCCCLLYNWSTGVFALEVELNYWQQKPIINHLQCFHTGTSFHAFCICNLNFLQRHQLAFKLAELPPPLPVCHDWSSQRHNLKAPSHSAEWRE